MRIGLTYDLRSEYLDAGYGEEETAEFDSPATIEAIEGALRCLGHEPVRIGRLASLVGALARPGGPGVEMVFNIAEGMHGAAREAQVPALLDAFGVPYTFSDPLVLALSLHKGVTKRLIRDMGLPTAPFRIVERPEDAGAIDLPLPLFIKPVAEGTSKGIGPRSIVRDRPALVRGCAELLDAFGQPVLVEAFLPGREVTVGIVGTGSAARAIGTMEVRFGPDVEERVYSHEVKERWEGRIWYSLAGAEAAAEAESIALAAWRGLGCRDGGRVDLRADEGGRMMFLEVNPLPGLNPVSSDLPILCGLKGIPYERLIGWIVGSALDRAAAAAPRAARRAAAVP